MALSGQITVTTAGTAVQMPNQKGEVFALKAHPSNSDLVWVGNVSFDVASSNGYPLSPGESVVMNMPNLKALWVDSTANGGKLCWVRLS